MAVLNAGYVRLHRTLLDHAEFRNGAEAMAFAWMIARAAWSPVCVRYKGRKIALQRGQLAVSQRDMAREMDRDKCWVERLWRRLQNAAMIKAEAEAGVAVITICNYDEYQAPADDAKALNGAEGKARPRQRQGTEQGIEEYKKETPEGVLSQKTRKVARTMPPKWLPEPCSSASKCGRIIEGWSEGRYEAEVEAFRAHHGSRANAMVDWQAAWHTWVLNSEKFDRQRMNGNGNGNRTAAAAERAFGPASEWSDDRPM